MSGTIFLSHECWVICLGGDCVKLFTVLPDKRHILTSDRNNKVTLWDVFTVEWPMLPWYSESCEPVYM